MPKVKPLSDKGVHVTGEIRDLKGQPVHGRVVQVSIPYICTWRGKILLSKQSQNTDRDGRFEFYLPPSSELKPVEEGREPPLYDIMCENLGTWQFEVPKNVLVWRIGEVKHEDEEGESDKRGP